MIVGERLGRRMRVLASLFVLVLALGLAACGSDDGDDGDGGASAATAQQDGGGSGGDTAPGEDGSGSAGGAAAGGSADDQIRAVHDRMTDAVYAADYEAACANMDKVLHKYYSLGGDGCAAGMKRTFGKNGPPDRAGFEPKIVKVDVNGDKATAKVEIAGEVQPNLAFFAKENGEWKVTGTVREDTRNQSK